MQCIYQIDTKGCYIINKSVTQTGFDTIDSTIGGFHNGDLIFLCSRPEIDKTSFALNIAKNILDRAHRKLLNFVISGSKIVIKESNTISSPYILWVVFTPHFLVIYK
ncbi:MAG: hypothetical protein IJ275_04330 [Ruminococcus sp.]|nr:hypothetical protein [Ruminococcus sp.]